MAYVEPPGRARQIVNKEGNEIKVQHYVKQIIHTDLDILAQKVLRKLADVKDSTQKQFVAGMKEAKRNIERGLAEVVIIAPNVDDVVAESEQVEQVIRECGEKNVPFVFALSRNRLGKAIRKNVRSSVVVILDKSNALDDIDAMISMTEQLRQSWVAQEGRDHQTPISQQTQEPKIDGRRRSSRSPRRCQSAGMPRPSSAPRPSSRSSPSTRPSSIYG